MKNTTLKTLLLLLTIAFYSNLFAKANKDSTWLYSGTFSTNLSQVSMNNWASGGESSIGWESMLAYSMNYKKNVHIWNNRFEFAYGLNNTDDNGTRKTNDRIYMSSNRGHRLKDELYLSALVTFQTQFAKGYDYDISDLEYISKFMSPGYLTVGAGLTWTPKPYFSAIFSPATWRGTFVLDDSLSNAGAYGVDEGDKIRHEFGANLQMEVKYEFLPNMTIFSRLNLYSNYLEKMKNVDVAWDVILTMKVNNWVSANITTNLLYDDDQKITKKDGTDAPRLQFKEVLNVGLHINF